MNAPSTRPGVETGKAALETGSGLRVGTEVLMARSARAAGGRKEDAGGDRWPVTFSGKWKPAEQSCGLARKPGSLHRAAGGRGGEG